MNTNGNLNIRVETYLGEVLESATDGDHNSHEFRVWLGKHSYWALRNGRKIVTFAIQ